jgi:histone chaperone ASF1
VADVSVLFLNCFYRGDCFARAAFYVTNVYTDPTLIADPPKKPQLDKLERIISVEDSRLTVFPIKWFDTDADPMPPRKDLK